MKINLRVFGDLKDIIGVREVILDIPERACVQELPNLLENQFGSQIRNLIGDEKLFSGFRLLINGSDSFTLGGSNYIFNDGDSVTLLPPMVGG